MLDSQNQKLSSAQLIEQFALSFQESLKNPDPPDIADFLQLVSPESQPALFEKLLILELEHRATHGPAPAADDYAARFPQYLEIVQDVFNRHSKTCDGSEDLDSETTISMVEADTVKMEPSAQGVFKNYLLIKEIARGGMGVVYQAREQILDRIVALKMIIAGELAHEDDIKRFYTEARAAALLDHPHIVPIFEVGEHQGQHFYAMAFIEGESLSDRIKRNPLAPKEAAAFLLTVTEAIGYAHRQGIIHRDLKPANILIDKSGAAKVTDFGLAKRMEEDSGLTASGQILGTPNYMPPEQAAGNLAEVGPASDIYSLGAVLYHMITGRPPFQAAMIAITIGQVLGQQPVPPSTLNPSIDKDLETICLKCLEKKTSQRFASAEEMAEELKRYLEGKPILTRPISRTAKTWRWCKKNPVIAALIATVFLTLVVGIGVSSFFAVLADQRAAIATKNTSIATEQTQLALDTITTIIFDINAQLREIPEAGEQRRAILKNAIEQLDLVSRGFENADEVNSNRAGALINLGDIYSRIGDEQGTNASARSFELFKKSAEQFEQLVDEQHVRDPQTLWRFSVALQRVGSDLVDAGKLNEAEPYLERCAKLRRELAAAHPEEETYRTGVIHILYEWGDYWKSRRSLKKAIDAHAEGLEHSQRLLASHPQDCEINSLVVYGHDRLADAYYTSRMYDQSLEQLQLAHEIYERLLEEYPRSVDFPFWLSYNREYLGNLYFAQKKFSAAEEAYQESLDAIQRAIEIDPLDAKLRKSAASAYDNFCLLYREQNRPEDLTRVMKERIAIRRKELELDPADSYLHNQTAQNYRELGQLFERRKEFEKAAEIYRDGQTLLESLPEASRPQATPEIQFFQQRIESCQKQLAEATQ